MNIQEYIEQKKEIQNHLLIYIDTNDDIETNYENLIRLINDLKIKDDYQETKLLLYLISSISNNHYRSPHFFAKIEKILLYFKKEIKEQFSFSELFKIFEKNKRILLFLIQEEMIPVNQEVYQKINERNKSSIFYFFPEFKNFLINESNISLLNQIDKEKFNQYSEKLPEDFERKRKIGENDSYICQLIRNDSIDEFITYVNKECLSLNSQIEYSLYETNHFLLMYNIELIEYAAFFGSVQIFKYLYLNHVDLSKSLWIYGIHGDNPELLHILEENNVINDSNNQDSTVNYFSIHNVTFSDCFKEAITCFHKDIAYYIESNYLNEDENIGNTVYYCFKFYNLFHLPLNFDFDILAFFYACEFDYFTIVKFYLMSKLLNMNEKDIFKTFFF